MVAKKKAPVVNQEVREIQAIMNRVAIMHDLLARIRQAPVGNGSVKNATILSRTATASGLGLSYDGDS